jgi:hypothetical protein
MIFLEWCSCLSMFSRDASWGDFCVLTIVYHYHAKGVSVTFNLVKRKPSQVSLRSLTRLFISFPGWQRSFRHGRAMLVPCWPMTHFAFCSSCWEENLSNWKSGDGNRDVLSDSDVSRLSQFLWETKTVCNRFSCQQFEFPVSITQWIFHGIKNFEKH